MALDEAYYTAIAEAKREFEATYGVGNVWTTRELEEQFTATGFSCGFAFVTRKSDGIKGCVSFQHSPRVYFDFRFVPA